MKACAINIFHSASISFLHEGKYHTIELERLFKERYFDLTLRTNMTEFEDRLNFVLKTAFEKWGITNDFDVLSVIGPTVYQEEHGSYHEYMMIIKQVIHAKEYIINDHHHSHAACTYYQSPYNEAIIVSYDGSGNDGVFNIYHAKDDKIERIKQHAISSLGKIYKAIGYSLGDIKKVGSRYKIPGKLMGLCAYGDVKEKWLPYFMEYERDGNMESLSSKLGIPLIDGLAGRRVHSFDEVVQYTGKIGYDIAATHQFAFENRVLELITPYIKDNLPICISGGCALNVLVNERVRKTFGDRVFVSPNPDDSGLSLGQLFLLKAPDREKIKDIVYSGLPIMDIDTISEYGGRKTNIEELSSLLKEGKIVAICRNDSELGPRALGNRSILCDPSFPEMKDKLNVIKNREWYRPFAPMVRYEDANTYFNFTHESRFMSFAPEVRDEYKDKIPAVVHVDGTARLQTVRKDQNDFIYDLLTEFNGILLNTSFNILGKPILTSIEDALYVLKNTNMDYVYIDGYLFQ